jgi:cardiolipin synthase
MAVVPLLPRAASPRPAPSPANVLHWPVGSALPALDRPPAGSPWADAEWRAGNRWRWLHDAPQAAKANFAAVDGARDHINLVRPVLDADGTGQALVARLVAKSRQGVKVHLLVGAERGWPAHRPASRVLREAGVHLAALPPPAELDARWWAGATPADERGACWLVVDGRQAVIGLAGAAHGPAVDGRLRPARRQEVALAGPAVALLQARFIDAWLAASGRRPYLARYFPQPTPRGEGLVALADDDQPLCRALHGARRSVLVAAERWQPTPALAAAAEGALQRGVELRVLLPADDDGRPLHRGHRVHGRLAGLKLHAITRRRWPGEMASVDGRWAVFGATGVDRDDGRHPAALPRLPALLCADAEAAAQLTAELRQDLQRARPLPAPKPWFLRWLR